MVKSVLVYTLSSEAKAAHSSPPEPNITPQFDLPSQAKVLNPDKIPISIWPNDIPSTYMLFSARKSREEQENPRKVQLFSNQFIRDHGCATMVVRLSRLSRNCATQILNFISCSDWFSRVIISTEPIRAANESPR